MHSTVQTCHTGCPSSPRRFSLMSLIGLVRSRNDLAHLSDTQLLDIGVTKEEAHREAHRPIWDVPAHWMK